MMRRSGIRHLRAAAEATSKSPVRRPLVSGGLLLYCAALLMVGACATVPTADRAQDAEMKTFLAPANQARIYVVRDGGYMSGAYQLFRIIVDGRDYGPLAPWTYFAFTVDPGTHSVTASGNENQERVRLTVEAGKLYFVSARSTIGITNARVSTSTLSDLEGRDAVSRSRLAVSASD
jgi:Protein of unknown function (DUF2846)